MIAGDFINDTRITTTDGSDDDGTVDTASLYIAVGTGTPAGGAFDGTHLHLNADFTDVRFSDDSRETLAVTAPVVYTYTSV